MLRRQAKANYDALWSLQKSKAHLRVRTRPEHPPLDGSCGSVEPYTPEEPQFAAIGFHPALDSARHVGYAFQGGRQHPGEATPGEYTAKGNRVVPAGSLWRGGRGEPRDVEEERPPSRLTAFFFPARAQQASPAPQGAEQPGEDPHAPSDTGLPGGRRGRGDGADVGGESPTGQVFDSRFWAELAEQEPEMPEDPEQRRLWHVWKQQQRQRQIQKEKGKQGSLKESASKGSLRDPFELLETEWEGPMRVQSEQVPGPEDGAQKRAVISVGLDQGAAGADAQGPVGSSDRKRKAAAAFGTELMGVLGKLKGMAVGAAEKVQGKLRGSFAPGQPWASRARRTTETEAPAATADVSTSGAQPADVQRKSEREGAVAAQGASRRRGFSSLWSWSKHVHGDPKKWPYALESTKLAGADPRAIKTDIMDIDCCAAQPPHPKRRRITVETTVKQGDSLWGISRDLTGDGANWKDLVKANPELFKAHAPKRGQRIDDSKFVIQPGWKLKMPIAVSPH